MNVDEYGGRLPRPRAFALAGRALGAVPPPLQILVGIVSVQVGASLAKQLFTVAGAAGTVTLRLFFAAVVLLLVWRPAVRLGRRAWPVVLTYGVVLGLMNLSFYQALMQGLREAIGEGRLAAFAAGFRGRYQGRSD